MIYIFVSYAFDMEQVLCLKRFYLDYCGLQRMKSQNSGSLKM